MTLRLAKWLVWGGLALLIAYDLLIGIPNRVSLSLVLAAVLWAIHDLNKRLEAQEESTQFNDLMKQFEELNKRLRWVEHHIFGTDRDGMMSEEWSARNNAAEYEP